MGNTPAPSPIGPDEVRVSTTMEALWGQVHHPVTGYTMVECPTEVTWLRNTSSKIFFMHGGEEVKSFGEYTDFYGPLTDVSSCMEEARAIAERFGVDLNSTAEVTVVTTIEDSPVLKATSREALEVNAKFLTNPNIPFVKRMWREFPDELRYRLENEYKDRSLQKKLIHQEVVWSSGVNADAKSETIVSKLKNQFFSKEEEALSHV
jgi:hypothetical protein